MISGETRTISLHGGRARVREIPRIPIIPRNPSSDHRRKTIASRFLNWDTVRDILRTETSNQLDLMGKLDSVVSMRYFGIRIRSSDSERMGGYHGNDREYFENNKKSSMLQ